MISKDFIDYYYGEKRTVSQGEEGEKAEGTRQKAIGRRQEALGIRQEAIGSRQEALGIRQEAIGSRQFLIDLNNSQFSIFNFHSIFNALI